VTPSISVIVPCFNVREYIIEAIESIINQTIQPDEVILIDDGSTDGTSEILGRYTDVHNFRVITTSNNGLGPARNLGRMLAKSEYVYFFDADDMLKKEFIFEIRKKILDFGSPDIIFFGGYNISIKNNHCAILEGYLHTLNGCYNVDNDMFIRLEARGEYFSSAPLYISKKSIWSDNKINFPAIIYEDEAVLLPLLVHSKSACFMRDVFYLRRVREGSITTRKPSADNVIGLLYIAQDLKRFITFSNGLASGTKKIFKRRLAFFLYLYVEKSFQVGLPVLWVEVISGILLSRCPKYFVKIVFRVIYKRNLSGTLKV